MLFNFPAFYRAEILNLTLRSQSVKSREWVKWSTFGTEIMLLQLLQCLTVFSVTDDEPLDASVLTEVHKEERVWAEVTDEAAAELVSVLISSHALNRNNKVIHGRCPDFLFTAEASYKNFREFDRVVKRLRASAASSSRPQRLLTLATKLVFNGSKQELKFSEHTNCFLLLLQDSRSGDLCMTLGFQHVHQRLRLLGCFARLADKMTLVNSEEVEISSVAPGLW